MRYVFIVFIFFVFFAQCKEKTKSSKYGCEKSIYDEPPGPPMTFSFNSNQKFYLKMGVDSTKDTLALTTYNNLIYYRNNSNKVFIDYVSVTRYSKDKHSKPFILSGEVLLKSYFNGIKQFYIDWPDGSTDSLYADFILDNSKDNSCCCQYPLKSLKLNSMTYTEKLEFDKYGIYLFD
jgi:hypothetical protein